MSKILSLSDIALTGETKITCNRTNQIGKATLTCIGLKKIVLGWIFSDVQSIIKEQDGVPDFDSGQILLSPKSEFEKFVVRKFEKVSKRASMMKISLRGMNEKLDEIINNYVESSTQQRNQLMKIMRPVMRMLWRNLNQNSVTKSTCFSCLFDVSCFLL
ncbi:hypothetical protein V8G54_022904 [Vigna mungo]|uniref:Uncharacterized protein n=1 Tax=Vigna mungo TaxID=3915 RepID=A0AAQ3N4B5_VIGMU